MHLSVSVFLVKEVIISRLVIIPHFQICSRNAVCKDAKHLGFSNTAVSYPPPSTMAHPSNRESHLQNVKCTTKRIASILIPTISDISSYFVSLLSKTCFFLSFFPLFSYFCIYFYFLPQFFFLMFEKLTRGIFDS